MKYLIIIMLCIFTASSYADTSNHFNLSYNLNFVPTQIELTQRYEEHIYTIIGVSIFVKENDVLANTHATESVVSCDSWVTLALFTLVLHQRGEEKSSILAEINEKRREFGKDIVVNLRRVVNDLFRVVKPVNEYDFAQNEFTICMNQRGYRLDKTQR